VTTGRADFNRLTDIPLERRFSGKFPSSTYQDLMHRTNNRVLVSLLLAAGFRLFEQRQAFKTHPRGPRRDVVTSLIGVIRDGMEAQRSSPHNEGGSREHQGSPYQ
jgi:hypothetical protein